MYGLLKLGRPPPPAEVEVGELGSAESVLDLPNGILLSVLGEVAKENGAMWGGGVGLCSRGRVEEGS